jgi:hypothetical protein
MAGGAFFSSVNVAGTDAIFLAGRTDITIPAAGGTLPAAYPLVRNSPSGSATETFPVQVPAASGATFQFLASGIVNYSPGGVAAFGPDGSDIAYRMLNPVGGSNADALNVMAAATGVATRFRAAD